MWTRARGAAVVVGLAAGVVVGCEDTTEPEALDTGAVSFEWVAEGETSATSWVASGSCGSVGFDLGTSTCAVGSDQGEVWVGLGVIANEDGTYDVLEVVHPADQASCEASYTPGTPTSCYVQFFRNAVDFPESPYPVYVTTSGTITMTVEGEGDAARLVGTFEGQAEQFAELEGLPPITITGGTFDLDFVDVQ